jgi:hypothetical protein
MYIPSMFIVTPRAKWKELNLVHFLSRQFLLTVGKKVRQVAE